MKYSFLVEGRIPTSPKDEFVTASYEVVSAGSLFYAWSKLLDDLAVDHVEPYRITMAAF